MAHAEIASPFVRSPRARGDPNFRILLPTFSGSACLADVTSSAARLGRWLIAAAVAWAAHHAGFTINAMEIHMAASLTLDVMLDVQGEAHGVVGPGGVR